MTERAPEDVFTPKTIVTREMFARRDEPDLDNNPGLQDSLRDALRERGGQVLLYGDTGVGKSSLLKYAAEDEKLAVVIVECLTGMNHQGLIDAAIRQLVDVQEMTRGRSRSVGAEGGAEASLPWIAKLTGTLKGEASRSAEFKVVEKPALDVLVEAMQRSGKRLIVFDNFQNIDSVDTRKLIAQILELMSDRAGRGDDGGDGSVTCVVIGIASDASTLLGSSRSYGRRTTEIGVPRMPDDELREVLKRGFKLLNIYISDEIVERLVFYADGFPYFAHLLGLYIGRAARQAGVHTVADNMIPPALKRATRAVTTTYQDRVRVAFEAGGEVAPRRNIMRLLAQSDAQKWTSGDIQNLWAERFGERQSYNFLHVALGQLITEKFGRMLVRSGTRTKYIYRFEDPHLRPYLRIEDDH